MSQAAATEGVPTIEPPPVTHACPQEGALVRVRRGVFQAAAAEGVPAAVLDRARARMARAGLTLDYGK